MANVLAIGGPNSKYKVPNATPAGLWAGLWHGIIAPPLFWISLLSSSVRIYETNNKGRRYDFGFLAGLGAWASPSEAHNFLQTSSSWSLFWPLGLVATVIVAAVIFTIIRTRR